MRTKVTFALPLVVAMLLTAAPAFAHEQQTFLIGKDTYYVTVGSLGEPLFVDDKSGVELMVSKAVPAGHGTMAAHDDGDGDDEASGEPVLGLDKTLKVELIAADKKRDVDFAAAWGTPGSYGAPFYPTVATTISYRIHGTIADTPFDATFTCNPAGHPQVAEDTNEVAMGEGVKRIKKSGAFGCPRPKAEAGFPEQSATLRELSSAAPAAAAAGNGTATGLGAAALVLSVVALARSRKQ